MPQTADGLLILLILIPGFVMYHAMDQYLTRERPADLRLLLHYLTYSGVYIALTWPLADEALSAWWATFIYMVIVPLALGLVIGFVTSQEWWAERKRKIKIYKEPYPTGWDAFFNRRIRDLRECYVKVTMKNGRVYSGYLGGDSSASEYPLARDLYLEYVCRVDSHESVPGSEGIWIAGEEISAMEFFKVGRDEVDGEEDSDPEPSAERNSSYASQT